jgi:hypothetical protein
MSKRSAVSSIYIMIFLTLFITSLLLIRPAYKTITQMISSRIDTFRTDLENKTGLTFSYSSMSPSILTVFSVKGIVLKSVSDQSDIMKIHSVVLRYNLIPLLRKDMQHAFRNLTIDGVEVDYNDASDRMIVNKIIAMIQKQPDDSSFSLEHMSVELPVAVVIKNVSVRYRGNGIDAVVVLKKASAQYNHAEQILEVFAAGSGKCLFNQFKQTRLSGKFSVTGSIRNSFEGSTVLARFSNMSGGDFSFGRLNFLISYNNRRVSMRTIQNSFPLMLQCSYGIDSGEADISLRTNSLTPSSFISARGLQKEFVKKLSSVNLSVNIHAVYNTNTAKFEYMSDGTVYLQDSLVPGTLNVSYKLSGDKQNIHISRLLLKGKNYDAEMSLSYEFRGMRLSGTADVSRVVLPNGGVITTELFFDPLKRGFQCFSPQVFLNDKTFTALQLTVIPHDESIDYRFEVSDYAHPEAEKPGKIQIDGSYLTKTKYVQAGVDISNVYLDSIADAVSFFVPKDISHTLSSVSGALKPYLFSGEFYLSSDMKSVSYNIPYAIVANTKKDNLFLLMSLDGNESSLQVTQFDFIYGKNTIHASAEAERSPDSHGSFFTLDMNAGAVPYHFTGNIMDNFISVAGDYGTSVQVQRSRDGSFEGSLVLNNFPVTAAGTIFTMSTETGFAYTPNDGFAMNIARFEAEEAGSKFYFAPKLQFSGKVTRYGAFFDSVSYSDIYSALNGSAQLILNMNEGLFNSVHFDFLLKNPLSTEQVSATADVTNPDSLPFSGDMLRNNLYFNAQLSCRDFGLNRFIPEQSDNNSLTASVTATGTFDKPYIALNIDSAGIMFAGIQLSAAGNASLVEHSFTIDTMHLKYGSSMINNIKAEVSLDTYEGTASAEFDAGSGGSTVSLPLNLTVSDTSKKKGGIVPDSFVATISSPGASGTLLKKTFPFSFTLLHGGGDTSLFSSDNLGISGHVSSSGEINLAIAEDKPFHCTIAGKIENKQLDIGISGIYADLAELLSYLPDNYFQMYSGILTGAVKISGLQTDPEFTGDIAVSKPDFSLPKIVPSHITADKILVTMLHNEILVPEVALREHNENVFVKAKIYFDRWAFDRIEGSVKTVPGHIAPADLDAGVAEFKGLTAVDLGLVYQGNALDVTGSVYVENVKANIRASEIASALNDKFESSSTSLNVRTDLDIVIGAHVSVVLDPLLRCILVPNTSVNFKMDQSENIYAIKGDVSLKSGDVAYLNRNFYLKEGVLKFNDTDGKINPRITVRAETRERDENGDELRIILTAENQYLSDFNPQVSSIPAKSETDIRELLGQIAVGDSTNMSGLLFAASDYAVQSTVGRAVENKLRDLLNFDIFSVRTMVLQNTLKMGFAGNLTPSKMTVGNFLDNSTVYMGKYFGSAVYVDALMHLSYDETRIDDTSTVQGIVFQPEFGLELESPFANIRWNLAPNIDAMLNNMIVSSTSLTLSWKFSF